MIKENFIAYLSLSKKSERSLSRYPGYVETYERYLVEHCDKTRVEEAAPVDLRTFVVWGKARELNLPRHLQAIQAYYAFSGQAELFAAAREQLAAVRRS